MVAQVLASTRREGGRNRVLRFLGGLATLTLSILPTTLLPASRDSTWPTSTFLAFDGRDLGLVLSGLLFIPVLPLVSYRKRDWLFISFVPFYGFVVAARVGWRLVNLPTRDWPPRPGEVPAGDLSG